MSPYRRRPRVEHMSTDQDDNFHFPGFHDDHCNRIGDSRMAAFWHHSSHAIFDMIRKDVWWVNSTALEENRTRVVTEAITGVLQVWAASITAILASPERLY
ncbi:hypothetical protein AC578_6100 [Pseudocercospora eumusae]|uniref:Uncharacterized protein n=1 Tax=Pseudocercospora eumusae TaxID=321146 RepID=A0A139HVZ5_9PEZI|nr:hypothetical protein AC578_6100 [Pseudocercospora eumusae]